jgi:hypothetical protein
MATKVRMPGFKSEQEEAAWWDAHPEVITELFLKARKEGRIKRLPVVRGVTKPITIRMPVADVECTHGPYPPPVPKIRCSRHLSD